MRNVNQRMLLWSVYTVLAATRKRVGPTKEGASMSMRTPIRFSLAVAAFCAFSVLTRAQQAPPSADTWVSSVAPAANHGAGVNLSVGLGTTSYVKFNLSDVPAGPSVSKATLRLWLDVVGSAGQFDVYNLHATPVWQEGTLKLNTPPPVLGTSATGGHPIAVSASGLNSYLLIDVTATVQGWWTTPASNNEVALVL